MGECLQPGLAALLSHNPIRTPRCQRVVESFVSSSNRMFLGKIHPRVVETRQITHSVVGCCRHNPRITAFAERVAETVIILKYVEGLYGQGSVHRIPVDCVFQVDIEIRDDWLPLLGHIRRRRNIFLFDILQLSDQSLLRSASLA